MRYTKRDVEAKIKRLNQLHGKEGRWNEIGAYVPNFCYGAYGVHKVMSESGGVTNVVGLGTARETCATLDALFNYVYDVIHAVEGSINV